MKGLTEKQLRVLSFIRDYIETHQFSPSYREIRSHFGYSSVGTVARHIEVLKRKGALVAEKHCKRSLALPENESKSPALMEIELPYIGYISSGNPIETFPQAQMLSVPTFLVTNPDSTYVLRARGDSLQDEMIRDGDLLLIETRNDASDGDTIIATTAHHRTLVKIYHPEGTYVKLTSNSPHTPPLTLQNGDLMIHGVLISLLRVYF